MPVFIIAEAGVNHNGEVGLAKRLIDVAAESGADAVKFQTFRADRLVSPKAPKAEYQLQTTNPNESQSDMLQRLALSPEVHRELRNYCRERSVLFLSTPFDEESADLLDEMGVPVFKIGSGEITNWPFLNYIARKGKPIILSTGMSYLREVDEAVMVIHNAGNHQLALLHCVSNYPANPVDANLRAMQTMTTAFGVPVGYSDHTLGIEIALAAVTLGASIIEKHFTLDKNLPGPDHKASLEPDELSALITGIRTIEQSLGNGEKQPVPSEENTRSIARRSVVAAIDIPIGSIVKSDMVKLLRPGTGIPPSQMEQVLGRKTRSPLSVGQLVSWSDLE